MKRENLKARLLRALSGKTQKQMGEETGIHSSLIEQFELGKVVPSRQYLERLAEAVGLTDAATEELLRFVDRLRRPRRRRGAGAEPLLDGIAAGVRSEVDDTYRLFELGVDHSLLGERASADDWPPVYRSWRAPR